MTAVGYSNLDIKILISDLEDVTEWFRLGLFLGLKHHHLKKIESQHHGHIEHCKIEMIEFWKKKDPKASLKKLTDALEKIDHLNLAVRLRERHKIWQEGIFQLVILEYKYADYTSRIIKQLIGLL